MRAAAKQLLTVQAKGNLYHLPKLISFIVCYDIYTKIGVFMPFSFINMSFFLCTLIICSLLNIAHRF